MSIQRVKLRIALICTAVLPVDTVSDFSAVSDMSLPFVDHAAHTFPIQIVRLAFEQCELQLLNGFSLLAAGVNCQCHLNSQDWHLRVFLQSVCPECL